MRWFGVARAARAALSRPGLCLWSGFVAVVDVVAFVFFGVISNGRGHWQAVAIFVGYRLVLAVALAILFPGAVAIYRRTPSANAGRLANLRAAFAIGFQGVGAGKTRTVPAAMVAWLVAVPATLLLAAVFGGLLLGVDTAVVWAAEYGVGVDRGLVAVAGLFVTITTAVWLVNGALAYASLFALSGESSPRRAWRESVAAVTARPLWYVGQSFLRGLLLASPLIAGGAILYGIGLRTRSPGESVAVWVFLLSVAVFFTVAAVARATLLAYHVDSFDERVRPAVADENRAIVEQPRRVAMAAIVLLAAIGGVAMIRTADVAPTADVPDAELRPTNADETVRIAAERTLRRDFAFTIDESSYNRTTDTWRTIFDGGGRIDRDTPEAIFSIALHFQEGDVIDRSFYGADGVYALTSDSGRIRLYNPLETRMRSGNWTAAIGRSFDDLDDDFDLLPTESSGWQRVASDQETITYATADVHQFDGHGLIRTAPDPDDPDVEILNRTRARIVIDRETATVREFTVVAHFQETYDEDDPDVVRSRSRLTITAVGDLEVERPDGLAGPGPLERLWDVVFYA